jgi:hypothetical protein
MDIPNKFFKIDVLLTDDGFVAVLEKLTCSFVTVVKKDCISG